MATAFTLGFATQTLGMARESVLVVQLGAILFLAAGIIHAGWWSDNASSRRVLATGCAGTLVLGAGFGPMIGSGDIVAMFVALSVALYLMGLAYGPLGAWLTEQFPARVRYTGVSIAFNAGGIIGGALTPMIAQALVTSYGIAAVGYYLSAAGIISLAGLWLAGDSPVRRPAAR